MDKTFYSIFKTFFKAGTLLLGGGYVILPLLTSELVDKKKWITSDELCEYYALGASLPGIIAANVAIFTGKKLLGTKGAIAAIFGMIFPAFLAIVLLASILSELITKQFVQNIFWGVGVGVIALLFLAVKEMWSNAVVDKFSLVLYIICVALALWGKVPLALIIVSALVAGIVFQKIEDKRNNFKLEESESKK